MSIAPLCTSQQPYLLRCVPVLRKLFLPLPSPPPPHSLPCTNAHHHPSARLAVGGLYNEQSELGKAHVCTAVERTRLHPLTPLPASTRGVFDSERGCFVRKLHTGIKGTPPPSSQKSPPPPTRPFHSTTASVPPFWHLRWVEALHSRTKSLSLSLSLPTPLPIHLTIRSSLAVSDAPDALALCHRNARTAVQYSNAALLLPRGHHPPPPSLTRTFFFVVFLSFVATRSLYASRHTGPGAYLHTTKMSKRSGATGRANKFRISLALPVAAVMNCADNTGVWHCGLTR